MNRVLVTGFGAYAEEADNPSGMIARRLDGQRIDGFEVFGSVLPVDTEEVREALAEAIESAQPTIVIVTGVAPGRTAPALERVAINMRDFPIPDIAGRTPIDEPVVPGAPAAYLSTLPIKAIVDGWRHAGIPGYVSHTAGTYLCNQTFYLARHLLRESSARTGMVHIPVTPMRAVEVGAPPVPSMSLDQLEVAVRLAISITAQHAGADLRIGGGAIS
ncbi:MAG: Pyrrolidone-carboxylate peptidase [Nocardia sp.]|uniref:pyroglutamyl-peptidase I n=1 Tax=Nocardia sp. TaxID=1821 RepID=UPI00261330A4|nr:pyroglutamyl-peptidase I [Nocardia sp.]MCU1645763.1 Pyrrolidone-carboxylate peptidase [Nocardia sp.]